MCPVQSRMHAVGRCKDTIKICEGRTARLAGPQMGVAPDMLPALTSVDNSPQAAEAVFEPSHTVPGGQQTPSLAPSNPKHGVSLGEQQSGP